jgi:hypothetical protein
MCCMKERIIHSNSTVANTTLKNQNKQKNHTGIFHLTLHTNAYMPAHS